MEGTAEREREKRVNFVRLNSSLNFFCIDPGVKAAGRYRVTFAAGAIFQIVVYA